ncbi:CaiB/BaiF CoA-transferase family protein [Actinophytocola sediminis]
MSSSPEPLSGVLVADLSSTVAGQYAGRLFALHGAQVVLVEPPGGSPTRSLPPRSPDGGSFLFRHLNQGKDFTERTSSAVCELLATADVVLRDQGEPPALADRVVDCEIGDFPPGPYAHWRGTEMVHQALAGVMNATGTATRPPIYGLGQRAAYATGTTAYISALAALHERGRSGRGQRVRATVFESTLGMAQNLVSQYSYNGTQETRARYPGFLAVLRCADAWVVLFAIRNWPSLCRVFGVPELLDDPRFATAGDRLTHWPQVVDLLQGKATTMLADDVVTACQAGRVSAEKVTTLGELVTSEHWRARTMLTPTLNRLFDLHRPPPAPTAAKGSFTASSAAKGPFAAVTGRGPLAGVRVLEFTTAWAGPFAGRCLGYLGADVVKIEAPSHPDSWRGTRAGGARFYYPDLDPGTDPQNRNVLFNSQNLDKRSLALDLKLPGSAQVLRDLAATADVVLANFTPGVLDRLGAGHTALREVNPGIIVVEMPAFGPGGPMSGHQGMGKTMEPASGMTALMGYSDGTPVLTGPAYLDPTGGLNAVAAVLTALALRARTGTGCRIEVPQVEAAAHWIGEYVLEQLETGTTWRPDGNAAAGFAPHDAYPCRGDDQWVAIAVGDDHTWRALCAAMDRPDLAADPRYATVEQRTANQHDLRAPITAWTSTQDKTGLASRLQDNGIPAAPVLSGADIATSEAVRAAGMVVALDHPLVGRREYGALGFRLDRTPGGHHRPAPLFGQHNDIVLRELLGYDDTRVAELRQAGAIADRPTADTDTPSTATRTVPTP